MKVISTQSKVTLKVKSALKRIKFRYPKVPIGKIASNIALWNFHFKLVHGLWKIE